MVNPAARKGVAGHFVEQGLSQRKACRLAGVSRSSLCCQPCRAARDKALKRRLLALASRYPRYGYLMLHGLLRNEGVVVNRKRVYRLYTEANLQLRTRRRKKLVRPRVAMALPERANQRWSMDFVHDQLADSRRFRVLNVVDDYTREAVGQIADVSISGDRAARFLDQVIEQRGAKPAIIVCDNGSEFTSQAVFFWSRDRQVKLQFIQPGKPVQNAFAESFNGRFRDNCLNQHWFRHLKEARELIEQWRRDYNEVRPHSSLNYQPPAVFARQRA